uniref:Uncharacterized protein n=1 Tax=Phytophthora ramorum TaxID=164328 RepID=H3H3V7_PHYRM
MENLTSIFAIAFSLPCSVQRSLNTTRTTAAACHWVAASRTSLGHCTTTRRAHKSRVVCCAVATHPSHGLTSRAAVTLASIGFLVGSSNVTTTSAGRFEACIDLSKPDRYRLVYGSTGECAAASSAIPSV